MTLLIRRHPLIAYFVLAYAITWITIPLLFVSLYLGVVGFLGPALAAVIVTAATEGREGVNRLFARLADWRVHPLWYVTVLGLPIILSLLASLWGVLYHVEPMLKWYDISAIALLIFVLVVGEELGWRGYALPHLLKQRSPLVATLILGVLWVGWHLPTFFVPGTPQSAIPFPAYALFVFGLNFVFTWVFQRTRGSLLIATLLHGATNTLGLTNPALTQEQYRWLMGGIYVCAALVIALMGGLDRPEPPAIEPSQRASPRARASRSKAQ